MSALGRLALIFLLGSALASCVTTSDSQTAVSAADIPASKYKQVAVFIENVSEAEHASADAVVVSTLQGLGVNAVSGDSLFNEHNGNLSDAAKVRILKERSIDALLYIKVQSSNEQLITNARFDGQFVYLTHDDGTVDTITPQAGGFTIKPDGRVYQSSPMLVTRAELQDVKSAKLVWTADTVTYPQYQVAWLGMNFSGGATASSLFQEAAKEIVGKMRSASAI
ncbi:MAG: hypothetical protein WCB19_09680 [Thermoplasmata archaeon]